jgi:hypothetical protein
MAYPLIAAILTVAPLTTLGVLMMNFLYRRDAESTEKRFRSFTLFRMTKKV